MPRPLMTAASAFALAAFAASPAMADLWDNVRNGAERAAQDVSRVARDTARDVGTAVENTAEDVADVVDDLTGAPDEPPIEFNPIRGGPYEPIEPVVGPDRPPSGPAWSLDSHEATIEWMQTRCPRRGQANTAVPITGYTPGERMVLAFCRVATDTAGDAVDLGQAARNVGAALVAEIARDLDALLSDDPDRKRELAARWAERFDRIEPVIDLIAEGHFETAEGRALLAAIQSGDLERAVLLVWSNSRTHLALSAAHMAGFETLTIGVGADGSLVFGAFAEVGVAFDLAEALEGRVGDSTYYATAAGTGGASVAVDGSVGLGVWTAPPPSINGASWGGMVAVEAGIGIGGGVWFDQDETANEGAGNFIGLSLAGSVGYGVEAGELARAATAVGTFDELTNPQTLLARLYEAARM